MLLQLQLSMLLQLPVVNADAVACIYHAAAVVINVAAVALITDRLSTRVGFMIENKKKSIQILSCTEF